MPAHQNCDLFYPRLGWWSDWVYHKLGNTPVLRSGTGSWKKIIMIPITIIYYQHRNRALQNNIPHPKYTTNIQIHPFKTHSCVQGPLRECLRACTSGLPGCLFWMSSFPNQMFYFWDCSRTARFARYADEKNVGCVILVAFITGNSSLEPLIEGLYAQIHVNLRWRVFGRNRTGDLTDY